jgi:hypothetical protein
MAKIEWDKSGERQYSTGTKNGILYTMLATPTTKTSYAPGVGWNGLTGVTETPSGAEASDQYADDMKYVSLRGAETFGHTVEAFMAPPEWDECDGAVSVGDIARFGQQNRKAFGMAFRSTLGNDKLKNDFGFEIHLIYNSTASPSERAYTTINESPEPITYSWECTSDPVNAGSATDKPVSNIIVACTVGNGVLKVDESGKVVFDETNSKGRNAKLLWDVLRGTDPTTGESATSGTLPTLPDPAKVYEILTLETAGQVETYAEIAS